MEEYSEARNAMFRRTTHPLAPWRAVRADVKKTARLELIRDLLESFSYKGKDKKLAHPDRDIVFPLVADGPRAGPAGALAVAAARPRSPGACGGAGRDSR